MDESQGYNWDDFKKEIADMRKSVKTHCPMCGATLEDCVCGDDADGAENGSDIIADEQSDLDQSNPVNNSADAWSNYYARNPDALDHED